MYLISIKTILETPKTDLYHQMETSKHYYPYYQMKPLKIYKEIILISF